LHSSAGREWVRRALPLSGDISALVLRKAVFSAGMLAYLDGDHAGAESFFADALLRYRDADDPEMTGRVELALERLAWDEDDLDAARSWFDTAKLRFEACGDEVGLAHCLHFEGLVAFKDGDLPQAEVLMRNSLSRWQALGFTWELTQCIPGHLADVARVQGNLGEAMSRYQECLRLNWNRRYLEDVSWSLAGLALVAAAAVPATAATGMCR
jgi:hypothetical protein